MGGGGGEEGDYNYTYRYSTRMTPALRWAAMRTILMFHCEGQSHKTVSTNHNLFGDRGKKRKRKKKKVEPKLNRTEVPLFTNQTPYR